MTRVILESPYAGDVAGNLAYARRALRDSLLRGEAPIASHLLYTQPSVLDDRIASERKQGMEALYAWHAAADLMAIYYDLGFSAGMQLAMLVWRKTGKPVAYRMIGQ